MPYKNKVEKATYMKEYRLKHKEEIAARLKAYRSENSAQLKLKRKEYVLSNREQVLGKLKELSKKRTLDLSESYIKCKLKEVGFKTEQITPELIELKRITIKTTRLCRQLKA